MAFYIYVDIKHLKATDSRVLSLHNERLLDLRPFYEWAKGNLKNKITHSTMRIQAETIIYSACSVRFYFKNHEDLMHFQLRWL